MNMRPTSTELQTVVEILGIAPESFQEVTENFIKVEQEGEMKSEQDKVQSTNDRACEERPSLDEVLRSASLAANATSDDYLEKFIQTKKENTLLVDHMQVLEQLGCKVGECSVLVGTRGIGGFENPGTLLNEKIRSGKLDEMEMDDFEAACRSTTELERLWEGQVSAQVVQLACNAILYCVLNNPALKKEVFSMAYEWVDKHCSTLKSSGFTTA